MPNILTVTLNPALDFSTVTETVVAGPKLRCAPPRVDPGGGGVNVSRAIRILGGKSLAILALGGTTGQRLGDLLVREGITTCRFELEAETRSSLAVTDMQTGKQYRFVLPGPIWNADVEANLLATIARLLRGGEAMVLSGSQPEGVSMDFASRLNDLGASVGARLAVDISGPAQRHLVDHPAGVWFLRMDGDEARQLSGRELTERADTADFAAELVARGVAGTVVIGRGEDGSVLAWSGGRYHCCNRVENIASTVGAGDSLTGAMVMALDRGDRHEDALRLGVAAASAAVLTEATELCRAEDVERLLPAGRCSPV